MSAPLLFGLNVNRRLAVPKKPLFGGFFSSNDYGLHCLALTATLFPLVYVYTGVPSAVFIDRLFESICRAFTAHQFSHRGNGFGDFWAGCQSCGIELGKTSPFFGSHHSFHSVVCGGLRVFNGSRGPMAGAVTQACRSLVSWCRHRIDIRGVGYFGRAARRVLTLCVLLGAGLPVQAFDARGHEVVVQLASRFFSADTEALLRNYYGSNYRLALINDANAVAITNQLPENRARLALHYTWFDDDDTQFDPAKHCPQAMCSVGAVLAAERALATPSLPRAQRMEALRALMHYMGDLHDPMNAGYRTDSSGRDIMLMGPDLRRVSLHAIWQSLLFDYLRGRPFEIANAWGRELTEQQVNEWSQGNPQVWIWETHEVARNTAYATVGAADGWNAVYRVAVLPTFEEQLQRAAVRLAQRLNAVSAELAAQGAL